MFLHYIDLILRTLISTEDVIVLTGFFENFISDNHDICPNPVKSYYKTDNIQSNCDFNYEHKHYCNILPTLSLECN